MPQLIVQVCNDSDGKGHYLKKYTPGGLFSFDLSPFLPFLSIAQEESLTFSGTLFKEAAETKISGQQVEHKTRENTSCLFLLVSRLFLQNIQRTHTAFLLTPFFYTNLNVHFAYIHHIYSQDLFLSCYSQILPGLKISANKYIAAVSIKNKCAKIQPQGVYDIIWAQFFCSTQLD